MSIELLDSLLNTSMESKRLSSSGGKYSDVRSRTSDLACALMMPVSESHAEGCARISLPRLLVRQMIVFCLCYRKMMKTGKRVFYLL